MFSQEPCFGVKEKITHIVETTKIVPQIDSTWALPIKIVNAKKLLQVFAIFLNAFSILIGSGYSWFRCRFFFSFKNTTLVASHGWREYKVCECNT